MVVSTYVQVPAIFLLQELHLHVCALLVRLLLRLLGSGEDHGTTCLEMDSTLSYKTVTMNQQGATLLFVKRKSMGNHWRRNIILDKKKENKKIF